MINTTWMNQLKQNLQQGGDSKSSYRLLRRTSAVETQVSCLSCCHLTSSTMGWSRSNTDLPKAKGLPVVSPNLLTA